MSNSNGIVARFFNKIYKTKSVVAPNVVSTNVTAKSVSPPGYASWSKEDLILKIKELEVEKQTLTQKACTRSNGVVKRKPSKNSRKNANKPFDFSKFNTRFVALRFAYLGWNYNGLVVQKDPTPLPTVEFTILEAMLKCKLIPDLNTQDFNFSRCGRTDKGVSAMNQVIAMDVRSNFTKEEQMDSDNDRFEIDYIRLINNRLPPDIRIHSICLNPPPGFDARFGCKYRHYKYIFKKINGLDLEKMKEGALLYEGENKEFRNFCKLDGSKQITNFQRSILSSKILPINEKENIYCFDLKGSAFLWHQVRNMMAILFLIGQGLEKPEVINDLMDIEKYPRKPIYEMANDIPLILYDCKFRQDTDLETFTDAFEERERLKDLDVEKKCGKQHPLKWKVGTDFTKHGQNLNNVFSTKLDYEIKNEVAGFFTNISKDYSVTLAESKVNLTDINRVSLDLGDGVFKNIGHYQPISKRQTQESVADANAKFKLKLANKAKK